MTDDEADDAMCGALKQQLDAIGVGRVEWPNVPLPSPPLYEGTDPWVRLTIMRSGGDQATFGQEGARRFERSGVLTVQCFVPAGKRGLVDAGALAKAARDAYEGRTLGGVRLYRVARKDVGLDGPWWQVNVEAAFEYEELR